MAAAFAIIKTHYEMLTGSMFVGVQIKFPFAGSKVAPSGSSYASVKSTSSRSMSDDFTFSIVSSPSVAFSTLAIVIVGLWFAETFNAYVQCTKTIYFTISF